MAGPVLKTWGPTGYLWFDSSQAAAGVPLGFFDLDAADTLVKEYTALAGRTVRLVSYGGSGPVDGVTVDVDLGYPRLTVEAAGSRRIFMAIAT